MCYSAEVSFLTWGFGMACAAVLAFTGQPVKSFLLPLVVTQMQLIEGLRWIGAVDERLLAVAGKLTIYAQPIAAMIEGNVATKWIALYAVVQTIAELLYGKRNLTFKLQEDGHFKWNWIYDRTIFPSAWLPYYIALLFASYMVLPLWVWVMTWGGYVYYYLRHWEYGTHGSLWCVFANLLWIYYLLR